MLSAIWDDLINIIKIIINSHINGSILIYLLIMILMIKPTTQLLFLKYLICSMLSWLNIFNKKTFFILISLGSLSCSGVTFKRRMLFEINSQKIEPFEKYCLSKYDYGVFFSMRVIQKLVILKLGVRPCKLNTTIV